jgi:CubicO group peptidase (beta-lactamase class C family)
VTEPGGSVAPGFEPLRDLFADVVASQGAGTGSALAATVDGRLVVDLWGGTTNPAGRPWQEDTVCVLFSGTKGVVATALLCLVDQGRLVLGHPVSDYWPEFAAGGKAGITVAQMCAHAAGLPYIDRAPVLPPGHPTYHAITYGWLCDGLLRGLDGRTAQQAVEELLARPLSLDLRIGLAEGDEAAGRLAQLVRAPGYQLSALTADARDPRLQAVYSLPRGFDDESWLEAPTPAANGISTARSMAQLYGAVVTGQLVRMGTLEQGIAEASAGEDPLSGRPLRFGPTGYELWGTPSRLGPATDAFGHTGAGGSTHGGWPGLRTGFSFVTSELRREDIDGRAEPLLDGLHEAVVAHG